MPKLSRDTHLGLLAAATVIVVSMLSFGISRAAAGDAILGGVEVSGVGIGGMTIDEARDRLAELERDLRTARVPVKVGAADFELQLASIEYRLDVDAILDQAVVNGRTGNVLGQFAWWLRDLVSPPIEIPLPYRYDEDALDLLLRGWEVEGLANPPFPGEVAVVDDEITYVYPAAGTGIDREAAVALISASIGDPGHPAVVLPTTILLPRVTAADVDAAVAETARLLAGGVTLTDEPFGREVVIPRDVLGSALVITLDDTIPEPEFEFAVDAEPLVGFLDGFAEFLSNQPVDAEILIDTETDEITLVPSIPVYATDEDLLADAVWEAMNDPDRAGILPLKIVEDADFSTVDAEALGIKELLGEFTTYHACCQRRVINIQLMADKVDGALVLPGEEFSLNDRVGRRTVAAGFVCAGALVGGELVEEGDVCIGGGTSQFTTTLHNAVFFAGLEHVDFTPHSAWFSRYPEGREATIGWREPEYIFRNDTEHALIIKTLYTPDSITVKIYGDNGGLEVEAGLSDRYNFSSVRETIRLNNELKTPEACSKDTAVTVQGGHGGWSVTVYRYLTYADGTELTQEWNWHYTGLYRIKEYNPATCEVEEEPPPEEPEP
ncbi:MAG TPA: VanW family protein [Acidimicrobiia bacterium]|nr:VanW family protein [Acidimicrobiia bacterium]